MGVIRRTPVARRVPDESPFRARGFLVSVGFLVGLITLGVIVLVRGEDSGADTNRADKASDAMTAAQGGEPTSAVAVPQPIGVPSTAPALPSANPATVCPPSDGPDRTIPRAAPAGVTWSMFRSSILPLSVTVGPTRADGDVVRCFQHSPVGALIATAQISSRYAFSPDWRNIMDQSLVPGSERDTVRASRENAATAAPTANSGRPGTVMQIAGFKFVSYADETAVIQIVRSTDDGAHLVSALYTVHWVGDDWRLQIQADGSEASMIQRESSLSGFVMWSAGGPQ